MPKIKIRSFIGNCFKIRKRNSSSSTTTRAEYRTIPENYYDDDFEFETWSHFDPSMKNEAELKWNRNLGQFAFTLRSID